MNVRCIGVMITVSICASVAMGCLGSAGPGRSVRPVTPEVYRLAPPDEIQVSVRGVDPPIERQVAVRPDGSISFDLIGDVKVAARTVPEVQAEIKRRLQEFIVAPDVTVSLIASNSRKYYVFGEVNRVGSYELIGDVTVVEALATAGGPTLLADLNGAWLARSTGETAATYRIRFDDITQLGDGTTNYYLQPGDVVYVPPGTSGQIGNALRIIFYPFQQIIGIGGRLVRSSQF